MINLHLPAASGGIYANVFDVLLGPLGGAGAMDTIPMTLDTDALTQGPGAFGEKAVDHQKGEGNVFYVPSAMAARPDPSPEFPLAVLVDVAYAAIPEAKTVTWLPYGILAAGGYGYSKISGNYYHKYLTSSGKGFIMYDVTCPAQLPFRVVLSAVEVQDLKWEGFYVSAKYRTVDYVLPAQTFFGNNVEESWLAVKSASAVQALIAKSTETSVGQFSSFQKTAYVLRTRSVVSPSKMKLDVAALIATRLNWDKDPNKLIHYGELAMRASENANANPVNMLAFLRDLRRPQDLIPKIRNLRKLKTYADVYLTVDYGVLPTIDDLKDIYRAMRKHKPNIDKNGFKTTRATHRASSVVGLTTYDLEQRIKIAYDDVDGSINQLFNEVDSMGFLLTFENIWDLIPYSFVIDWFLDIGDMLRHVDANLRLLRLGVQYSTMSFKRTATAELSPTPESPYSGSISLVLYSRWTTGYCPEPPLSLPVPPEGFDHWIEASALIIQRGK